MDAFYAAVEQRDHPELRGRPVAVGGDRRRGVVSTASYAARRYGIHSAMPLRTAFRLCPQGVFLPVDYEAYEAASRRFKAVLRSVTTCIEDVGIDEAYLEITDEPEGDAAIAARIKAGIRAETGLTCSIGIAPNKLLAKIASDLEKPDGVTILTAGDIEGRLWPLPIRKLYGVGPKTEAQLRQEGIETIGQLAALPLPMLVRRFGPSYGGYLHEAARGIDESPVVTHWEPKSFSREHTFQQDVGHWQTIARTIAELTREVAADLARRGYAARNVAVKVRYRDFRTVTRACTALTPLAREEAIRRMAFACLQRVELKGRRVRLVGVRVGQLERIGAQAPAAVREEPELFPR